jgi:hypothetical protein
MAVSKYVDIVFGGPPSHVPPRFVEVEDDQGASIGVGGWLQREDGYWVLRITPASLLRGVGAHDGE